VPGKGIFYFPTFLQTLQKIENSMSIRSLELPIDLIRPTLGGVPIRIYYTLFKSWAVEP
jgi:hypothetical protein